jgi:hypothetical protein
MSFHRSILLSVLALGACVAQIPPTSAPPPATPAPSTGGSPTPQSPAPGSTTPAPTPATPPSTGNPDPTTPPAPTPGEGTPSPDATPAAPSPSPAPDNGTYNCTLVFGINATEEWYKQGFEKLVDDGKWELIRVHSGFIELWANPNDGVWKTAVSSPCTQDPTKPDRILFVALNFDFTTLDQWLPPLTATAKNLKAKYPSAKRIELMTFVRAPGNKACPQGPAKRSTIVPAEDQAIEMVVATDPSVFAVGPKFEATSCSEFSGNPPHPSAAGGTAWAKMVAAHYAPAK